MHRRMRSALLAAMAALTLGGARQAAAQTLSAAYAPGCGPGTVCDLVRFALSASGSPFALNTLTITLASPHGFVAAGGTGIYTAEDEIGAFGGFTTVSTGGSRLFINFLDTGDPENPGLPFTIGAFGSGYVEVDATATSGPLVPFAFNYMGELEGGGTITGSVGVTSVVPEPATVILLSSGMLCLWGSYMRRRRRTAAPITQPSVVPIDS